MSLYKEKIFWLYFLWNNLCDALSHAKSFRVAGKSMNFPRKKKKVTLDLTFNNYWIPLLPESKNLIAEQVLPKTFVSQSIFIIGGGILINKSTNLKQEKTKYNKNENIVPSSIWGLFAPKTPKQEFCQVTVPNFQRLCCCNVIQKITKM